MADSHPSTPKPSGLPAGGLSAPSHRVDLRSSHITRLSAALEDAFSSLDWLRQMLRQDLGSGLSLMLESVVPTADRTLPAICQDLVLWALRDHRVGLQGLLAAALRTNPTNPQLLDLQKEWDGITFTAPACPYPGMKAYTAQWGHFYGRDGDIATAVNRLRYHPFLAIIGPSGSGKSSLLHAGILPALGQSHHFADKCWDVRNMRPGATPYTTLLTLLDMPIAQQDSQSAFQPNVRPDTRLLMLVDQYEELYTTADVHQRKLFEQALLHLRTVLGFHLVITARADFYADLMTSPLWSQISNHRLEVTPLRGDALRQAVERPARDVGVLLEPALVERLLADAGDDQPGILPFMQETLNQLWERADQATVGLAAYTALVAGNSGRSGLQVALDQHSDRVYWDRLADDQERTVTRRIMLRLVQFSGDSTVTRRQMTVNELGKGTGDNDTFDRVLATLTHNRLLTLSDEARRVDLSHEAMIHGWSRLSGWVNERRLAFQTRRRLEEKATERQRLLMNNGNGGLLDPVALAEAQAWVKSADAADVGVSDGLEILVADSHQAIQRSVAHLRRRNQVLVSVAAVAIVATAVAVLLFFNAQREAQNARNAEIVAQANAKQAVQQQATAVANAKEADKQRAAALAAQATAEANRSEVERAARRLQAESLAANSQLLMQRDHIYGDRTMLLARDAVQATLATDGYVTSNADAALRAALGGPNWRMTLPADSASVEGEEYAVAYSPDGTLLAGGRSDGAVRVWDAKTGDLRAQLDGHGEAATAVAFSPDGLTLASSGSDSVVRLWNTSTWTPIGLLEGHGGTVNAVAFSPDGRVLASGSDDGSVRLWDSAGGQTLHILEGHQGEVTSVAFSPDGDMLASGNSIEGATQGEDASYNVQLWDTTTGEPIRTLTGHRLGITSLAFSPTGSILASSSQDKTVRLWDVETGQTTKTLERYDSKVNSVTFLPYRNWLISGSADGTVRLWDIGQGSVSYTLEGHNGGVNSVAVNADGSMVASAGADGSIRLWDTRFDYALRALEAPGNGAAIAAFGSDGNTLAVGSWDGHMRQWEVRTGNMLQEWKASDENITALTFSPDSSVFAEGTEDGAIRLWDSLSGELLRVLNGKGEQISSLAFSPDSSVIASGIANGVVQLSDRKTGKPLRVLTGPRGQVADIAFSPDGTMIASANTIAGADPAIDEDDFTLWVWDARTGELLHKLNRGFFLYAVAFSADGNTLASSGEHGRIQLWNAHSGEQLRELYAHTESSVESVAFSPDGGTLASGSSDGNIWLWNAKTGRPRDTLDGYGMSNIAFSPDGNLIAAGTWDGKLRVWPFKTELLLALAEQRIQRPDHVLTADERRELDLED